MLGFQNPVIAQDNSNRTWLAGDHHIHSRYSVGWNREVDPPSPIIGGDAIYPTPMNALMAKYYGLSWMVTTDHGGPNHSKVNLEMAYPELLYSRKVVSEVIQFYGMEFDTPGADHSSLIVPHTHDESTQLHSIESQFSKREPYPSDSTWDTEPRMLEALAFMNKMATKPVVIANHPSRSASDLGVYGRDDPAEFRDWNDTAPDIAVGMAGAPGHQAATLNPDSTFRESSRGGYGQFPTMGGFDQMTAKLGGFWDSMLGEGRRWWITANSDSHVNWREGGSDFWPGEYSKTYVFAQKNHDDIIDGIRNGRVFVTLGDLISELYLSVEGGHHTADIGGAIHIAQGEDVTVTIRFKDPDTLNSWGKNPEVTRVDLIMGEVTGPVTDRNDDSNPTTQVIARFTESDWIVNGEYREIRYTISELGNESYIRIRGTNSNELEPQEDEEGESPWDELWFYSNPIFIDIE
ncbi:hypothetical protein AAGF08_04270 [Algoriphagus sp. SE2]|uniref:hypothetical protein n=1 Tax=Algoriphagus sp. SE2 TaxID=3141536 RepID=UPI0031CDA647